MLQSNMEYEFSPEGQQLLEHASMFGAQDKFVDYIHHVESKYKIVVISD
jgi:hypothetical protein